MRPTKFVFLAVALLLATLFFRPAGFCIAVGEESQQRATVRVDDLGHKVIVLGRLEQPLRKMMSVKGTWKAPESQAKPAMPLRFHITEVDGEQLSKPVEFREGDVHVVKQDEKKVETQPTVGDQWEIRAYETWSIYDHPAEYLSELGVAPGSPIGHDVTQLIGIVKKVTAK